MYCEVAGLVTLQGGSADIRDTLNNGVCDRAYHKESTTTMSFDGLPTTEYAQGDTYTTSDNDDVHCITDTNLITPGVSS